MDARSEKGSPSDASPSDTGREAEANVDAGDTGCLPAVPPSPPVTDDDGGLDADYIFAMHTLDLGGSAISDPVGYDLDGVCTCPGASSCILPSTAADGESCDRPGGRDNAAGALFAALGSVDPHLSQAALSNDLNDGQFSILLRLHGYNGSANDSNVILEFFNSPGIDGKTKPSWDGTDSWKIYSDNVATGGGESTYVGEFIDLHAYVANYTLVGHFPSNLTLRVSPDTGENDNYLELPVSGSVLTLQLDSSGPTETNGTFAARMSSSALLSSVHVLADDAGSLCGTNTLYKLLTLELCPAQDIMANPATDNTNEHCDALSLAINFTVNRAHLGSLSMPPQVPASCPVGWNPSCEDAGF